MARSDLLRQLFASYSRGDDAAFRRTATERRSVLTSHCLRPRQRLLLVGPSGTGKTASAHAVAAELSLPVATASLAALSSSYLGDTGRNVEAVIRFAEQTPCVLVLDEFDVLAQERAQAGDHGEIRRVVAVVLQLLEDLKGESLVVATSNHPQLVDIAMWRRFDEVVPFSALDVNKIATLIGLRLRAVEHSISTQSWSRKLRTASPAEVELVCVDAMSAAVARLRSRTRALKRAAAGTSAATEDLPNQT